MSSLFLQTLRRRLLLSKPFRMKSPLAIVSRTSTVSSDSRLNPAYLRLPASLDGETASTSFLGGDFAQTVLPRQIDVQQEHIRH